MKTMILTPEQPEGTNTRAPWEADPDAWKGENRQGQHETPAEAVNRLLEEVAAL